MLRFFLFIFSLLLPFSALAFNDVSDDSPFFSAIQDLQQRGLLIGYEDDTLRPSQELNRVEALKVALASFQKEALEPYVTTANTAETSKVAFSDLAQEAWYTTIVKFALDKKIVSGYPDNLFRPEKSVNLVEALKILYKSASLEEEKSVKVPYHDIDDQAWYMAFVRYAYSKKLIAAQNDGLLHPEKALTRGEFFEIVSRLLWVKENKDEPFRLYLHWPQFPKDEHYYRLNIPHEWKIIEPQNDQGKNTAPSSLIIWRKDLVHPEETFTRAAPYSASLHIVLDENFQNLSSDGYFETIEKRLGKEFGTFKRFTLKGLWPALRIDKVEKDTNITDLYVFFPNKKVLVFYSSYGVSDLQDEVRRFVISVQHSLQFVEKGGIDVTKLLEESRQAIGVEKKGREILNKYPDLALFETDAIGVGTGPVDYFFSPLTNTTMKYERSFDVILDIQEGKTSAF